MNSAGNDRFSVDALLLFHDVVTAGGINRAAAVHGLPKSSISRRVRGLEEAVGAVLLKRGKTLGLTEAGEVLYDSARRIAAEMASARARTASVQKDVAGKLRVRLPPDFGHAWIGRALAVFALAHPEVELEVRTGPAPARGADDAHDLVIHLGPVLGADEQPMRTLATLPRGAYVSPAYVARRGVPHSPAALKDHDCIVHVLQQTEGIWPAADTQPGGTGRRIVTDNINLVRDLVLHGAGVGIMPAALCARDVRTRRLQPVLEQWQLPALVASVTFLERRHLPRKTRVFLDFLIDQLNAPVAAARPRVTHQEFE